MRFRGLGIVAAMAAGVVFSAGAFGQIKISQIYGGGNVVGGTYNADYVELFNPTASAVNLAGFSLQTSTTTITTSVWHVTALSGTIQPGHYMLIQNHVLASGANGAPIFPAPDLTSTNSSSTSASDLGRTFSGAAIVNGTTALPAGCPLPLGPSIIDFVRSYDPAGTNPGLCVHGSANAPIPGTFSEAIFRKDGGCADTEDDVADFEIALPNPRNSAFNGFLASAFSPSSVIAGTGGTVTLTVSKSSIACNPLGVLTGVAADLSSLGGSPTQALTDDGFGNFSAMVTISGGQGIGTYTIPISATTASESPTSAVLVRVRPVPPSNDDCASAYDMNALGLFSGTMDNTTAEVDQDTGPCGLNGLTGGGVWFKYTPAQDEILQMVETSTQDVNWGVYTGTCASQNYLACFTGEGNEANPQARVRVLAGTQYLILVGQQAGWTPTVPMQLSFTTAPAPAVPANDTCATAEVIVSFPYTGSVNADNARDDPEVSACASSFTGVGFARHGVWYRFTTTGAAQLNPKQATSGGSANAAAFAVWSGACGSLSQVSCVSNNGVVDLPTPGTYYLQVYMNNHGLPPNGAFVFNIELFEVPANDDCVGATDISGTTFPLQITQSIIAAHDDPDVSCNSNTTSSGPDFGRAVWFKMTAPVDGVFSASNNSSFSSVFAWYGGCGGPEDGCQGTGGSAKYFAMTSGQTIYIAAGEWLHSTSTQTNPTIMNFDFVPVATNLSCATAIDLTGQTLPLTVRSNQQGASDIPAPYSPCTSNPGRKAVYFRYTSSIHGRLLASETATTDLTYFRAQRQIGPDPCNNPGDLEDVQCSSSSPYRISFPIEPGQTYFITAADGTPLGNNTLEPRKILFDAQASTATNDACATARDLTGAASPYHESIADIRYFSDSPDVACNTSSAAKVWHGLWYSYTPATNTAVTMSELVSGTNIVSASYTTCGGPQLGCFANEENYLELDAGQTYKLLVGYDSSSPGFTSALPLDLYFYRHERTTHDLCASARPILGFPYSDLTNIDPATADGPNYNQTTCGSATPIAMQDSVWYKLVVTASGQLTGTIWFDTTANKSGAWAIFPGDGAGDCPTTGLPLACGVDGTNSAASVNVALSAGVTYYLKFGRGGTSTTTQGSLVQLDLSFTGTVQGGACCDGGSCGMVLNTGACAGTYQGDGSACSSNPCPQGVCCRGATCTTTLTSAAACSGSLASGALAGASFATTSPTCNTTGNTATPCCYANYNKVGGLSVQDIFDFLNDWFASRPYAKVAGDGVSGTLAVQDIFDFLNAWFAGC
ncbi:MAG TPA: lamin tail domain-containing protein [Phycisphaerales bacterium]|nr:lamin tail domain-containing protein [Phycisphaerales bacterium]